MPPHPAPGRPAAAGAPRLSSAAGTTGAPEITAAWGTTGTPGFGTQSEPGGDSRRDLARPLPDPVAIRVCPVPGAAPPYDDEVPAASAHGRADALAVAIVAALGGQDRTVDQGRTVDQDRTVDQGRSVDQGRTAAGVLPAGLDATGPPRRAVTPCGPADWPSTFAQVLAETLAGSRPPAQIAPWTTDRARSHIRKLGPALMAGQRPLVQRIVTSRPASGVLEMSVIVGFGPRVRALAVRMERTAPAPASPGRSARPQRWLCTAIEAA
jgi:hypothetical protein